MVGRRRVRATVRRPEEHHIFVSGDRSSVVGAPARSVLIVEDALQRLDTDDHDERPKNDADLAALSDQVRGEEIRGAKLEGGAQLVQTDLEVHPAAGHPDETAQHERRGICGDPPSQGTEAQTFVRAEPAHDQTEGGQKEKEVRDAEPQGQRRVGRDVLEDVTLCRDRVKTGDRELLEEQCRSEQEVDADHGVRDDEDDDHRDRERRHQDEFAARRRDRAGVEDRDRQGRDAQDQPGTGRACRVAIARRPRGGDVDRGAHLANRRRTSCAATVAAASANAGRERPGPTAPDAPSATQTRTRRTARAV